jgi:DNA (cytosine-5)-methyltransferase 1
MSKLRTPLSKIDNYPAYLNDCWQLHLRERDINAPTVISTFAGCGGSSLGYSMAGFRELLAIEWDKNAVETFKLNFTNVPVIQDDIAKISIDQIIEMTKLKQYELDVLDGSPPCQGFSTAGKRIITDERNQLYKEYVRLLNGLQPKVFVFENVSGLVKGKMKLIFADIMRSLKDCGYKVSARLLNAMYFGVPQSRERLIIIGVREDLGIKPSHPKAIYMPVTVFEGWGGEYIEGPRVTIGEDTETYKWMQKIGQGMSISEIHPKGYYFNFKRLSFIAPSSTLIKNGGKQLIHPIETRTLTTNEYKRLGSFPDEYKFIGTPEQVTSRIGNSVPPLFMYHIAKHIKDDLLLRQ